jgi:endonuclease/exonuclease/phosphatase family metal-dependent hydrolase
MRRLRVVSWNVGRLYTPTNNNRLDSADVPQVAATLHELDPDLALLQELVDQDQLRALESRLPGFNGRLAERCRYDRKVAVLARERLEPTFEQHVLEPTGRGLVAVGFSVGRSRGVAHPVHFDVFNQRRRRQQAEALSQLLDARSDALVIAGGDFNLDPDWAARLGNRLDSGTFAMLAERFPTAPLTPEPTLLGLLRVDHLLVRGALMRCCHLRVSPGRRLPLGDHDPLIADVDLHEVDVAHGGT